MAIRGDLLSVDLSNVFQMLSMNRKRGILHIQDQVNLLKQRALVVDEDRIGLLDLPPQQDVWALLVDSGALDYESYRQAQIHAGEYNVSRTQLLSQKGLVNQVQIAEGAKRYQEEQLLEIFLWREISFTLEEDEAPAPDDARVMFSVDLIVMEAARRQDEWLRAADLLGGAEDIWARPPMPSFATQPATDALTDTEKIVLDHVDGIRGTDEIMKATALPRYHIDLALCRLMTDRLIRRLDPGELVVVATNLLADGRCADSIRLLNRALEHDAEGMEIHLRLAEAYLKDESISKAADHYKSCAQALILHEQSREAVDVLGDVIRLVPTDFESLRHVIDLLASEIEHYTESDQELFQQGVKLFYFHLEASQYDEASDLLESLIEIAPNDLGLNMQRARLLTKQGFMEEGVQVYVKVAGRLHVAQDYEGASNIYKTVLGFELQNPKITAHCKQRLEDIENVQRQKNRRRAFGFGLASMMVVVFLLGSGYFVYHEKASADLVAIQEKESKAQTEDDWVALEEEYEALASRYPFTFVASRAGTFAEDARHTMAVFTENRRNEHAKEEQRRDKELLRAENFFRKALVDQRNRAYGEALAKLRQALQLAVSLDRRGWAVAAKRRIPKRISDLELHVARNEEMLRTWREPFDEKRWSEAYAAARVILLDAYDDDPQATIVRLIDHNLLETIQVPLRLQRVPSTATLSIDGRPLPSGAVFVNLSLKRPTVDITISAPGSRESVITLDWLTSPFDSVVSIPRSPSSQLSTDFPPVFLVGTDGKLAAFAKDGRFALFGPRSTQPLWTLAEDTLVSITAQPLSRNGMIYVPTSDGRLTALDVRTRSKRFTWTSKGGAITALSTRGGQIIAAVDADEPQLVVIDAQNGREIKRRPFGGVVKDLAATPSGWVVMTEEGLVFAGTTLETLVALPGAPFGSSMGGDGRQVLLTNKKGALLMWRNARPGLETRYQLAGDDRFSAGPFATARGFVANTKDGHLVLVEGSNAARILSEMGPARSADWDIPPLQSPSGHWLIAGDFGAIWQVDPQRGQVVGLYRRSNHRVVAATAIGSTLYLAYDDPLGGVEVYKLR
ncbi:MAG: DUF4388 domain-containing protein [Planctomycetota bacterium]